MNQKPFEVMLADDALLVVSKQAGIPVIPDRSGDAAASLKGQLEARYGRLWVVHRIDRDTSGLVVFARHAEAHAALSGLFENRQVQKEYLAVVEGVPAESPARIELPLWVHENKNLVEVKSGGKPSSTLFKIEEAFRRFALLRVRLETGRRHQIRVHLAAVGHPLLIDPVYGRREDFYLSELKKKFKSTDEEKPLMSRLTLHAASLGFSHPVTGVSVQIEASLPRDMKALLQQLRKWEG